MTADPLTQRPPLSERLEALRIGSPIADDAALGVLAGQWDALIAVAQAALRYSTDLAPEKEIHDALAALDACLG